MVQIMLDKMLDTSLACEYFKLNAWIVFVVLLHVCVCSTCQRFLCDMSVGFQLTNQPCCFPQFA
jgi:hypothetical protein